MEGGRVTDIIKESTDKIRPPEWDDFIYTKLRADDAKKIIGKTLWYMQGHDIDNSGRGYYFPRKFNPVRYESRHLWNAIGDCVLISDIRKWCVREKE